MHIEIRISAFCKDLRAAGPEVGEPGDELLGGRCGRLVEVDGQAWDVPFCSGFRVYYDVVVVVVRFHQSVTSAA